MFIRSLWKEKKQTYIEWLGRLLIVVVSFLGVASISVRLGLYATVEILKIVVWPAVAVITLATIRPHLSRILSGAKIKLSLSGLSIETTLPELTQILEEQTGEALSDQHVSYLENLLLCGPKDYPAGVTDSADRKFLRPLRNGGLVYTQPRNAFLSEAQAIEISGLGRLFLRGRTDANGST